MNIYKIISYIGLIFIMATSMTAQATIYEFSYTGWFTLFDVNGNPMQNPSIPAEGPMLGWRTPLSGTGTWDDVAQFGTDDLNPFQILGGTMTVDTVTANAIGDGNGGSGSLILGNATATWSGFLGTFTGIPLSNVANLAGLFSAIDQGLAVGDTITGGAIPASNDALFGDSTSGLFTAPLGGIPIASTFFNTTPINPPTMVDDNPSGGLPIFADFVPGSTMQTAPFTGFSGAFDVVELQVTGIVPIPGAVWLFGSGLAGLLAYRRRRN